LGHNVIPLGYRTDNAGKWSLNPDNDVLIIDREMPVFSGPQMGNTFGFGLRCKATRYCPNQDLLFVTDGESNYAATIG